MEVGKIHSANVSSFYPKHWDLPHPGHVYSTSVSPLLERQQQYESEVRSYPRRIPIAITQALGARVKDEHGQIYLDCLAGAGALPLGHNYPEINAALTSTLDQSAPLQTLDITTPAKDKFMAELLAALPSEFRTNVKLQFCGPSGADAVEAALKLAKTHTGRSSVISFQGGYHGMTHGALSLTGNLGAKLAIQGLMPEVYFMPFPYPFRSQFGDYESDNCELCLRYLHSQLADPEGGIRPPAAIIVEPVQGEGGVIPSPSGWLQGLRNICDEFDILLIVDEIQTGFGRTGKMFAFEHAGIVPDILVMSKAVGGGLPLSVIAFDQSIDSWLPGGHAGTFRGNQLAMVSGATAINIIKRDDMPNHAQEMGEFLYQGLRELQQRFSVIGEVRAKGLMLGLEIISADRELDGVGNPKGNHVLARHIQKEALTRGLICELGGRHGAVIRLLPPLILNQQEAEFILSVLADAFEAVATDNQYKVANV